MTERSLKTITTEVEREPDYVKLYMDDLFMLMDIPKWANKVLLYFISDLSYDGEIFMNKAIKQRAAKSIGLKYSSVDRAVTILSTKNIFISKARGIYTANPKIFGRGNWSNVKKIRMSVTYSENGKAIISDIEKS